MPPAKLSAFESLTAREKQCLRLVPLVSSQKEIARALDLSPRTVHSHLGSAMQKLGVSSSTRAAILLAQYEAGDDPQFYGQQPEGVPQSGSNVETDPASGTRWLRTILRMPASRKDGGGNDQDPVARFRDTVQAAILSIFALGVAVSAIYGLGWIAYAVAKGNG